MLVSTSIPLTTRSSITAQARISAVYATAINPHTGHDQRVIILGVRQVYDVDPSTPWLVADVRARCAILGYSVPWSGLRNLSAFVTMEI